MSEAQAERIDELITRERRLAKIRHQLRIIRGDLSILQAYHAADLVGAVLKHMDRRDEARGNRRIPQ